MPRIICLVSVLSCAGCAGTGKIDFDSVEGIRPEVAAEAPAPEEDLQVLARTVSFQLATHTPNQQTPVNASEAFESGLPETLPEVLEALPPPEVAPAASDILQLNLPTVLSMIGGQHPAVGFAQWRVQQAYAQLDQAKALWLPSIRTGFSFDRHDGNLQASDGDIVDVNRNSFQYGLGVGASGAGTTPLPGLVAQFHMADAIFQPKIARNAASAQSHASRAVTNEQLMFAAVAYLELLDAHQDIRIVEDTRDSTADLFKLTSDFASAGKGLQADADRMETELALVENRVVSSRERIEVAQAALAQTISAEAGISILPLDPTVVPIELVSLEMDKTTLIQTGLSSRPELKESQALVAAACEQHRRQKFAPFVPSVLLGFSTGGFGGGLGNTLENVDGRYDFDALVSWVYNLGPANLKSSTLLKVLNEGKYEEVPNQMRRWNKVNKQVNEGLVRRRNAESLLFEGKEWGKV